MHAAHIPLLRTSYVTTAPGAVEDVGERTGTVDCGMAGRAHETSPGGTQEAVKNVSWCRAEGEHRTTAT